MQIVLKCIKGSGGEGRAVGLFQLHEYIYIMCIY